MPTQPPPKRQNKSTQDSMLISEIRDGIAVMRDGSLRAVILGSAINFDLMSPQERDAVEFAYQGFLNSLHFTIQIVVKSQKIDLDGYIEKLQRLRENHGNELLGFLMDDYIANIKGLIDEVNIMDKQFYIVVPFMPPATSKIKQGDNILGGIGSMLTPQKVTTLKEADFVSYKEELSQRVALVSGGLNQIGVRCIPLNTQELIDLYYASYNPDVAQNQKLIDARQLQTAAVTKGVGDSRNQTTSGGA